MKTLSHLVLAGALLLAGCRFLAELNADAYRQYHASRWQATATAYAKGLTSLEAPSEPVTPRTCAARVEPAYGAIITAAAREREAWRELSEESQTAVQFVAEMLDVLVSRDTLHIEMLTSQINDYMTRHEQLRENWNNRRQGVADALAELTAAWSEVWPGHDLDLDLLGAVAEVRDQLQPRPDDARAEALRHYHDNEYDRLALIYLDFEPQVQPHPVSHVPKGCEELAAALNHLEAGLLVRYGMDRAIESDVERVQQLALVDLSQTPWDKIEIPQGRYARPRVAASIARLKLLKYVDALLTHCLDVLVHDVELQWNGVWPQHELETNIFAYAGLPEEYQLPADPLADMTFRE